MLFINPRSGDDKAAYAGLAERARETRIETVILAPAQNLAALTAGAAAAYLLFRHRYGRPVPRRAMSPAGGRPPEQ